MPTLEWINYAVEIFGGRHFVKKSCWAIVLAAIFTIGVPAIGYMSLGLLPALLFLVGYLSGFTLWLRVPTKASFSEIKIFYWLIFFLFLLHRIEEKIFGFFSQLSALTGVPVPEVSSLPIILLLILSVGAWLAGPILYSRGFELGKFLIWSFFASMGITEMAHFVFPIFTPGSYGYFPGMMSVVVLAPVAWYAMWRTTRGSST